MVTTPRQDLFYLSIIILYFNQSKPLYYSSLLFSPRPCIVQQFTVCFVLACSYTDAMYLNIIHFLLFFSSFFPPLVSNSLTFGNMFCIYLHVYMIMLAFVSDLSSTDEWKHTISVFLNLANFTYDNVLQFHLLTCKWQNFIILYGLNNIPFYLNSTFS
jgi:hypothetical protein